MPLQHGVPPHMFYIFVWDRDKVLSARRDQRKSTRSTVLFLTDNLGVAEVFRLQTLDMRKMGDQLRADHLCIATLGNFLFVVEKRPVFASSCHGLALLFSVLWHCTDSATWFHGSHS